MSDDTHPSGDTGVSGWFQRLVQGRAGDAKTREDVAEFLGQFLERGVIGSDEFAMLQGVLEVADTQVRDIMVPRSQMVVVAQDQAPEEVLKVITESNHSRFPVIGDDRDEVVGIVLAKDLLKHFIANKVPFDLQSFLRPAAFIPESKRLNTLLTEFREGRNHMAIVVDEYGGVSGLATIEDVLEQIVGDIDDELDPEAVSSIQPQDGGKYVVAALTRISRVQRVLQHRGQRRRLRHRRRPRHARARPLAAARRAARFRGLALQGAARRSAALAHDRSHAPAALAGRVTR